MDFNAVKSGIEAKSFVLIDVRNTDEVKSAGKIPQSHVVPRKLCLYFLPVERNLHLGLETVKRGRLGM